MNTKPFGWAAAIIILVLAAGGIYWASTRPATPESTASPSTGSSATASSTASSSASASPTASATATASTTFKNSYLQLTVPSGWTARAVSSNPRAVNVTRGSYILYINSNASQASGVEGGRFAEIAQGAPSADAVIKSWPANPCADPVTTDVSGSKFYSRRADLYTAPNSNCRVPSDGSSAWYFSYLTNSTNRYFNYYASGQNPGLVVTMAYQTSSPNSLPKKGSADLNTALEQMTAIANSLSIVGR